MKGILAIYRREMTSYFVSPIAYIVVGLFLLISGFVFYFFLTLLIEESLAAMAQSQRFGQPPTMDIPMQLYRIFFGWLSVVVLFMVPMLTMGIYAEERKQGTMELLMTSPVSEFQIATAKFMAALTLFLAMLVPTLIYQIVLGSYSEPAPPWKVMWSSYLGLVLLGSVLIGIGSFISSLTQSQIIAGIATFAVFLLLFLLELAVRGASGLMGDILQYFSILRHFDDFSRGVIDTSSVIYYVSMTCLAVFLTLRSLDSMRWRSA